MSTNQEQLAADILAGFEPIGETVPDGFAEYVMERIASRPSPTVHVEPVTLDDVNRKLDEILTLLRGGNPE